MLLTDVHVPGEYNLFTALYEVRAPDAHAWVEGYREITTALEGAGVVRRPQETPEEYTRRASEALGEPSVVRLGRATSMPASGMPSQPRWSRSPTAWSLKLSRLCRDQR